MQDVSPGLWKVSLSQNHMSIAIYWFVPLGRSRERSVWQSQRLELGLNFLTTMLGNPFLRPTVAEHPVNPLLCWDNAPAGLPFCLWEFQNTWLPWLLVLFTHLQLLPSLLAPAPNCLISLAVLLKNGQMSPVVSEDNNGFLSCWLRLSTLLSNSPRTNEAYLIAGVLDSSRRQLLLSVYWRI